MPKCRYSRSQQTFTPLYVAENCAHRNYNYEANAYDIVTMITPERVYDCEKNFFIDSVKDNKLNPQKALEKCKSIVAPDTYKAFQEAVNELNT